MKKINLRTATNAHLDFAAAKAVGKKVQVEDGVVCLQGVASDGNGHYWLPTQNWEQGGPIIDRHIFLLEDLCEEGWRATAKDGVSAIGDTLLIAACRAFAVASFGEAMEIPDDLN